MCFHVFLSFPDISLRPPPRRISLGNLDSDGGFNRRTDGITRISPPGSSDLRTEPRAGWQTKRRILELTLWMILCPTIAAGQVVNCCSKRSKSDGSQRTNDWFWTFKKRKKFSLLNGLVCNFKWHSMQY